MRVYDNDKTTKYIENTFINESEIIKQARLQGEKLYAGMQISPIEAKLLQVVIKMVNAKNILEIGTFVGTSAMSFAQILPSDGTIITVEKNDEIANVADGFFSQSTEIANKIELIRGDAIDVLTKMSAKKPTQIFDIIFIDASKKDYMKYLLLVEKMTTKGSVIIGDNSLLFGSLVDKPKIKTSKEAITAMKKFNARLADNNFYESILLPTSEGMTIAVKK